MKMWIIVVYFMFHKVTCRTSMTSNDFHYIQRGVNDDDQLYCWLSMADLSTLFDSLSAC